MLHRRLLARDNCDALRAALGRQPRAGTSAPGLPGTKEQMIAARLAPEFRASIRAFGRMPASFDVRCTPYRGVGATFIGSPTGRPYDWFCW